MCPPKIEVFSQTTGIYVEIIYNPRVQTLTVKKRKKKEKKRKRKKGSMRSRMIQFRQLKEIQVRIL